MTFTFTPKWKEELVCSCPEGTFVIELTMGVPHVYFPTEASWLKSAPAWAKPRWKEVREQLEAWCVRSNLPLTVDDKAWVD